MRGPGFSDHYEGESAAPVLTIPPAVRIYLAVGATDLRRGVDGLAVVVRERFRLDPLLGHVFVFRNRRGDKAADSFPAEQTPSGPSRDFLYAIQ